MELTVLFAGLFVFLAHLLEVVFEKTRIPDILLLMLLGVLVGPILGFVQPEEDFGQVGEVLSVVTLLVILFESGLSLPVKTLLKAAGRAIPFSILSFITAVACLAGTFHLLLGFDFWTSMLGGFILGGTSSAVVIPIVRGLNTSPNTVTTLTLESTLTDVLCIIGTVGIATGLKEGSGVATDVLLGSALLSLLLASLVGAGAGVAWSMLLSVTSRMRNATFATLAFAMVVYGFSEVLAISGAIAALVFGITMANLPRGMSLSLGKADEGEEEPITLSVHEVTGKERQVYAGSVFLLKSFFFFYLGTKLQTDQFIGMLGLAALVLALVPLIPRYPVVRLLLSSETTRREALLSSVLVPRGLAAAVLATIPVTLGLPHGEDIASIAAMMVFFSIAIISVLVALVERGVLNGVGAMAFAPFAPGDPLESPEAPAAIPEGEEAKAEETPGASESADDTLPPVNADPQSAARSLERFSLLHEQREQEPSGHRALPQSPETPEAAPAPTPEAEERSPEE